MSSIFRFVLFTAATITIVVFQLTVKSYQYKVEAVERENFLLMQQITENKKALNRQDSIIKNFSPVITIKIPCKHDRR
jgi:hypothetical protein